MRELASSFRDVSTGDGDLQRRIDVKGRDGIDILGKIFNGFIEKLQNIMSQVMNDSSNLVDVASHLNSISGSFARATLSIPSEKSNPRTSAPPS